MMLFWCLLFLVHPISLIADGPETIIVKGDDYYPPFEYLNEEGVPEGYNIDITRAVAKEMGMDIRIQLESWQTVRAEIEGGRVDALMGMFNTVERDKLVDFSIPHFITSYTVFVREGSQISSLEDARDMTIILQEKDLSHDYVVENDITDKVLIRRTLQEALQELSSGTADCAVASRLMGMILLKDEQIDNVIAVGPPIIQRKYCFAVTEGNAGLLAKLNEGLSIVKTSGEYDRIYDKWFGVYAEPHVAFQQILRYVFLTVTPLLVILVIAFLWSWSLKKEVAGRTKELRESREDLKTTLNSIGDAVIATDINGDIVRMNPVAEKLTGWSHREAKGRPLTDVFNIADPRTMTSAVNPVDRVIQTGKVTSIHSYTLLRARDGLEREIADSAAPIMSAEGVMTGAVLVFRDVSGEHALKAQVSATESKLDSLFRTMSDMVAFHDLVLDDSGKAVDYRISDCNRAFSSVTGIEREDAIGKLATELYETDQAPYLEEYRRVATTSTPYEFMTYFPPLNRHFMISVVSPEKNKFVTIATDITAIKHDEEELRHLRNYLANIIDSMPSVLVGVDTDGNVTQWNSEAQRTTGVSAVEAIGQPLAKAFPRLDAEMSRVLKAMQTHEVQSDSRQVREEGGVTHYEDVTVYPLIANGVEGAVIRIDDVTERVRLEEMMVQTEKMLSVGGLAAGMAHEINNPLAGMMQTANVLANRLGNLELPANRRAAETAGTTLENIHTFMESRDIPHMIAVIGESGRRVATIVDNMLSFARKSDAQVSSHYLAELIDRTLELAATDYDLKKHYDFKMIEIRKEHDPNLRPVPCEGAKIQQVLLNILRNGAQAMEGAGTERPLFVIRTRYEHQRQMAVIEIEDNGPGMDEATCRRVFEPFYTTKPAGIGTGLGLSVSYFIITENHGGEMHAQSQLGSGATFVIRLPLEGAIA